MKSFFTNIKLFSILFIIISLLLLSGLVWQQYRSQTDLWAAAGENKNTLRAQYALAGDIYSRDKVILATSAEGSRRYSDDRILAMAALQLIGDYTHNMENTVEAAYQAELLGNKRNIIRQIWLDFTGKGIRGDDLQLTVDSRLMKTAYQSMQNDRGSAVLLNYKTGEVLAMVSTPSTVPDNVIKYQDIPDTALLNRSISGYYSPGSTFKMITAAAFMQSDVYNPDFTVDCTGQSLFNGSTREIYGHGHGLVDLKRGFSASCNIFFGEVGRKVGLEKLQKMAEKWGWNSKYTLDRLKVGMSQFYCPQFDEGILTWASIGQPVGDIILRITPLHLALQAATVANDGIMPIPHIIAARKFPDGKVKKMLPSENDGSQVMSKEAAELECELMEGAVATGFVKAIDIQNYVVGAKSGTAEIAGQEAANGLITAYIKDENYPLAVAVIMENIGAGAGKPLQVARNLLIDTINFYPDGLTEVADVD